MNSAQLVVVLLVVLVVPSAHATAQGTMLNVNPIRRVVTMLQKMQTKVVDEGKTEQKLFDAFMCYCKTGVGSLADSIKVADAKISQTESDIEGTDASVKQLAADLVKAKTDRTESEETIAKAKALRATEAKAFAAVSSESKTNIAAMGKALASLEKGMGGAFLQSQGATQLKTLSITADISEADRDVLASFLSSGESASDGYAPAGGQITGILKQMKETMEKDLAETVSTETAASSDFDALVAAKVKQVASLTKEIESKLVRSGEASVQLTNQQEELSDTQKSYAEDNKFLIDVTKDCKTKEAEKDTNDKLRADELVALSDVIGILNDDDALDLFKKTLPTPSLLQVQVTAKATRAQALKVLAQGRKHHKLKDYRLNLIALAIRGKTTGFGKVVAQIDEMKNLTDKEQAGDDAKKAYCEKELDESDDEKKSLARDTDDLEKNIDAHEASLKTVTEEMAALTAGIMAMDKQVTSATTQRKKEHEEYKAVMAGNGAAIELLAMAKNRLSKFYAPEQYKAPPKRKLSEEERIAVNMGGTLAPTAAPGGIAGTGVTTAFAQYQEEAKQESVGFLQVRASTKKAAPPPPPATSGAYKKSGEESNGCMAMLDKLSQELSLDMQEKEFEEKEAQKDYEEMIADSAEKRAGDAKSLADKEGNKVELQTNALKLKQGHKDKTNEAMAKAEAIAALHADCDWLQKNFETRKAARAGEKETLAKSKTVLNGASASFLQTASVHLHEQ